LKVASRRREDVPATATARPSAVFPRERKKKEREQTKRKAERERERERQDTQKMRGA
jgi:hypothetical protein